ncbi:uncharacterized protein LOC126901884 isoform X2 [Daktulosphaira vitifoliae]|uniref:uncharacterized protein LOC126901884 isoform X2 n=1 Tax=Daktulosphaira vitifoliae TaxID=58002 RepID=UPI0021AA8182|nr:uncharacterized protein LOC126901884 isoform X2 [Daktulosphaira vitifoliae]
MLNSFNFLLCLLIFHSISLLETRQNKSSKFGIIKNILSNVHWNSFNDVEYVKYWSKNYYLIDMLGEGKLKYLDTRIRIATIFLDCATTNFLYTILNLMEYFRNQCVNILKQDSSKVPECVVDILNIVPSIKLMLSMMKSAIDYLESFHRIPRKENKKNICILTSVIDYLQTYINLEYWSFLKDNYKVTDCTQNNFSNSKLVALANFHHKIRGHLDLNAEKYCSLKLDLDWNKWINEYNYGIHKTESNLLELLKNEIYEKIENFILEKYLKFGFQYDFATDKTSLLEIHDIEFNENLNVSPSESIKEGSSTQSKAKDSEDSVLIKLPEHLRHFNSYLH